MHLAKKSGLGAPAAAVAQAAGDADLRPRTLLTAVPDLRMPDSQERFRLAFESARVGLALVDLQGRLFEVNRELADILGFTREELEGARVTDLAAPEDESLFPDRFQQMLECGIPQSVAEMRFLHKEGRVLSTEVSCGLARSLTGQPMWMIATFRDITECKRLQTMLELQASFDPLTKALNRMRFEERARVELMRSDRHGHRLSMLLIDLDQFKRVNDTYGHSAGDQVLSGFGSIARNCLRASDLFGRWGGEEFVVLLPDTGPGEAQRVAQRLRTAVEGSQFPGDIRVTASIGIAGRRQDEEFASLIVRADAAMYGAKQGGRNRVVVDAEDLACEARNNSENPLCFQLAWKPSFASGQPAIDAEHRQFFHIANLILAASAPDGNQSEVLPLIHVLLAEVSEHFAHEEALIAAAGFSGAGRHAAIHRKLLARAIDLTDQFERGAGRVADLIGFLVHDVISNHMIREDRKYFTCFHGETSDAPGQDRLPMRSPLP